MVRASKTDKQSAAPAVSTPVTSAPSDVASAAPAKKEGKKDTKKATKAAAPVEEPAVVEAAAPLTNEVVAVDAETSVNQKMNEFSAKLQQLASIFSSLKGDFKTLEKTLAREIKAAQKTSVKKRRTGNRAPSGFVKPTLISDELAVFLGKSKGSEMARTAVSREINQYIRTNKLQNETNGRIIVPDSKLAALLKTQPTDELTYFNLQRFMKHHFIKTEAPVVAATTA